MVSKLPCGEWIFENSSHTHTQQLMELTSEQIAAVNNYYSQRLSVITGGPGVGKTTVVKELYEIDPENTIIIAPTGCAAQRVQIATGYTAYVFRYVCYKNELLEEFVGKNVILDEASMISVEDAHKLIRFLKPRRLCFVFDPCQIQCTDGIPFVRSLLLCPEIIPQTKLTINHRQRDTKSALFSILERIRTGEKITNPVQDNSFRIVVTANKARTIQSAVSDFMTHEDSQMLALTGQVTKDLNDGTRNFPRCRVVCLRNLYEKGTGIMLIANGMMGTMTEEGTIEYDNGFKDRKMRGSFSTLWQSASALTVNKAQGSEFECHGSVVMTDWHDGIIPREPFYTAISRFKHSVTLYGSDRVLMCAFSSKFDDTGVIEMAERIKSAYAKLKGHH